MPKIPTYNRGLGPAVKLATGELSPMASAKAFSAPGMAQAQLGQTIQDVAKVAAEFEQARQAAEVDEIFLDYENIVSDSYSELNRQETTSIDDFRTAEKTVRQGLLDGVDGFGSLGSAQKKMLKEKVNKTASLLKVSGEKATWTRWTSKASETANKRGLSILERYRTGIIDRDSAISEYGQLHETSVSQGITMNMDLYGFKIGMEAERLNNLTMDDSVTFRQLDELEDQIKAGEGYYSEFELDERISLANSLSARMQFLETEKLVNEQSAYDNAIANLGLPFETVIEYSQNVNRAQQSIEFFKEAGQFQVAEEMQRNLRVTTEVSAAMETLIFADAAGVQEYMAEAADTLSQYRNTDRYFDARQRYDAIIKATSEMQLMWTQDPANVVQRHYSVKYGRAATKDEIVAKSREKGLPESKIKIYTNDQAERIVAGANEAQTVDELLSAMSSVEGRYIGNEMRQLRQAGLGIHVDYIRRNPQSPISRALFQATREGGVTISVPATQRSNVMSKVMTNGDFIKHMKSLQGGQYIDFEGDEIRGAASDTTELNNNRNLHKEMIYNLAVHLMERDGQVLAGDAKLNIDSMGPYVDKAVKIITENFDYIEGFPNTQATLRIPAELSSNAPLIKTGLRNFMSKLSKEYVYYESASFEVGSKEFELEKERYLEELLGTYGFIASPNGMSAILIDSQGGVVFQLVDNEPVPLSIPLKDALASTVTYQLLEGDVEQAPMRKGIAGGEVDLQKGDTPMRIAR